MRPVMYLFLNRGLGMSTGKAAAQTAHAAVEAYAVSDLAMIEAWRLGGHCTKIVLAATDAEQLGSIERYLIDRDFNTFLVIDEGRTEISPFTPTALGVALVDKDDPHVAASFGEFKLYRDRSPEVTPTMSERAKKYFMKGA